MRPSPSAGCFKSASDLTGRWANRALVASFLLIVVATTFPFEFFLHDTAWRRLAPFPFWLTLSTPDISDFIQNVLLFMPFGFALACFMSCKKRSAATELVLSVLVGASLSFAVEFSQVFLPTRDPSWNDVVANAIGAAVGCSVFQLLSDPILRFLSFLEAKTEFLLPPRRAIVAFVLLAAAGFGISVPLQRTTSLGDWDASYPLYVGNDPTGARPWQGRIAEMEFASHAVSAERAAQVAADHSPLSSSDSLVASYRLSSGAPFRDLSNGSPELFWMPNAPSGSQLDKSATTGPYWLGSRTPAAKIAEGPKKTNQFTLRVVCAPRLTSRAPFGRIVSLSQDPYHLNFILSQEGPNLVFGLRTPLTGKDGEPALVAPDVFSDRDAKEITLTYDGSVLLLYVNGKRVPHSIVLSPGAALLHRFFRLREPELRGYLVVYDLLLFVPLGLLLAYASRSRNSLILSQRIMLLVGAVLPPSLLEAVLASVRGSAYNWKDALLGVCLVLGSAALCNADGHRAGRTAKAKRSGKENQGSAAETSFE